MINYLIINKLGTVLYQSAQVKKLNSNTGSINDSQRIRYLPLLVIKDLIKANLNNVIQYIKIGNKTVVFKEQQNLLYVACTKKSRKSSVIPTNLLLVHLKVMHNFIKFHYGPHWSLHIQGNSRSSKSSTISSNDIRTCLSQLPFISTSGKLSIRSCDNLCYSEQVQVSEDLRLRLTENMSTSCNSTFVYQISNHYHSQHHHYTNQHRNSFFSSRHKPALPLEYNDGILSNTISTWAYCFLFAREKIVAQCRNNNNNSELPDEFVYFLKLLVSQYLQEKQESGNSTRTNTTTLPQNISSNSTCTNDTILTTTTNIQNINDNVSPSSSSNSATTANSSSHPSSLAYVYDANSSSAPFKIREKSASSVTVVSSDSSISYWSNPLSNNLTHHLVNSPTPTPPTRPAGLIETRTPSNVLIPNQNRQQSISDILNIDGPYSNTTTSSNNNSSSFLSSSVPSESTITTTKLSFDSFRSSNNNNSNNNDRILSAPSSPTHNRSRSQSFSSNTNEDSSLKHILANLINGESGYLDQTEDVKLIRRWVKLDGHVYLANFILIMLSDGLCSVVICKDDPEKTFHKSTTKSNSAPWKPSSKQVKQFKVQLKSCLSDFTTFLLTKESTHFTNLSFAVTYPGLIHFFHLDKGVMISPLLVDLNELDKNHELLHEVYGKYYSNTTDQCNKWKWPTELKLRTLCNQLLELGLSFKNTTSSKYQVLQESKDKEYYFLYQKGPQAHQELLAIYFGIVPPDRLWNMHQKLFNDIGQRVLLSTSTSSASTTSSFQSLT